MIKFFLKTDKNPENLCPTLPRAARSFSGGAKGGFSNLEQISADIPLGPDGYQDEGKRKGKNNNL